MLSRRMLHLTPYVAGEQPRDRRYIKLNTNENPYPPSDEIARYLREIDPEVLRLYPDPKMERLRGALADHHGLSEGQVFVGNGSDEVLSFCFYGFFDSVVFPEHTYSFYPVYCDFYGIPHSTVPLRDDYGIDLGGLRSCGAPVIFANPNSPTGMYLRPGEISGFLGSFPPDRIVIVDEAYIDFGGESCVDLLGLHKNLVIVKTFSKSHSLAGLRLGYALADSHLIDTLFTIKDSFNSYPVSTLAQELGRRAIQDVTGSRLIAEKIISSRTWIVDALSALGWRILPSMANFIFASMPERDGSYVYTELKKRGILVRYFSKKDLADFVRITIGTPDQMRTLVETVKELDG